MGGDADKSLHRHSDGRVDRDGEEDLSDGKEPGDHVGQDVDGKVQGEELAGEEDVDEEDTDGVGDEK